MAIKRTDEVYIPQEVASIYARLNAKYGVGFERLEINKRLFHILAPQDLEPFVKGRDIFKDASDFPFWVKIWEASIVLSQLMASIEPLSGRTVLELGAGLGVTGIVASYFGHTVTITDYTTEVLDFARVSAAVNKCSSISFETLDWLKPSPIGEFDTIIGSEILFNKKFFEPLLNIFLSCLKGGGVVYMAHDARRKSLGEFLPLCERHFSIGMKKVEMRGGDENFTVLLTRLKRLSK